MTEPAHDTTVGQALPFELLEFLHCQLCSLVEIFKPPVLLLTSIYQAKSALAAAIPSNIVVGRQTIDGFTQFTGTCAGAEKYCGENGAQPRLTPPYNSYCLVYNDDGSGHVAQCWRDPTESSSSTLSVPRCFSLPSVVLGAVYNTGTDIASAIPRPHEITTSLASPDFSLVRKSVSDIRDMLSNRNLGKRVHGTKTQYVEIDGQRYKIFRPFDQDKGNNGWVAVLDNGAENWKDRIGRAAAAVIAAAVAFAWLL